MADSIRPSRRTSVAGLALFLALAATPHALAQSTATTNRRISRTEQELLRINREYDAALVSGDAAALERLYADDFVYTNFDGEVLDKTRQIAAMTSGDVKLESGRSDDVRVRVYGNTAVITGRFTAKGKVRGEDMDIRERYTAVLVKRGGRWRFVAEQGNAIKRQ